MSMNPPAGGERGKHDQRQGHHQRRLVRMMMAAIRAEERQKISAKHVEGGHSRRERAHPEHPGRMRVSRRKNRILTEESGKSRKARDGEARDAERDERNRHDVSEGRPYGADPARRSVRE